MALQKEKSALSATLEIFSYYSEDEEGEDLHLKDPRFDEKMYNRINEERVFGIQPKAYE